nr:MAG TPA: hypothetical protein [Caudoviricetes sp.]
MQPNSLYLYIRALKNKLKEICSNECSRRRSKENEENCRRKNNRK